MPDVRETRVATIGVNNVINAWKAIRDDSPYYAVYYNRSSKMLQWRKDDLDGGEKYLAENLSALEESGDNSLMYLNVYDHASSNYPNSGMVASFPFRLNPYQMPQLGAVSGPVESPALIQFMKEAHKEQMAMQEKLFKLQYENQPMDTWDRIGGLLETPPSSSRRGGPSAC